MGKIAMYEMTYEEHLKLENREMKGKSLLDIPKDYVLIDLETTGLSWQWDEIIEMAALKVRDNQVVDTYQQLIKPSEEIPDFITEINHITNEMVANAPTIEETLNNFLDFVGNDLIVGHNIASFDINFIYRAAFVSYGKWFSNNFVDTLRLSKNIFKGESHNDIATLIKRFNLNIEQEHRALSDCEINKQIYDLLVKKVKDEKIELGKRVHSRPNYKELTTTVEHIDTDNPFFGKTVVFTGKLERYERKQAAQIIINCGGVFKDSITKDVNFLVVGDTDYRAKTNKMIKAFENKAKGYDIEVIPESLFYELLEE